jgi:hypothetical protein
MGRYKYIVVTWAKEDSKLWFYYVDAEDETRAVALLHEMKMALNEMVLRVFPFRPDSIITVLGSLAPV